MDADPGVAGWRPCRGGGPPLLLGLPACAIGDKTPDLGEASPAQGRWSTTISCVATAHTDWRSSSRLSSSCRRQPNLLMPMAWRSLSVRLSSTGPVMSLSCRIWNTSSGTGVVASHCSTWSTRQSANADGKGPTLS